MSPIKCVPTPSPHDKTKTEIKDHGLKDYVIDKSQEILHHWQEKRDEFIQRFLQFYQNRRAIARGEEGNSSDQEGTSSLDENGEGDH